jgi:multiple sugar transport system ATP-binding protein
MARVALLGVRKTFGSVRVIQDLTLEVADGELVCLLGPSGSGKTTLLRMIAGLETLDAGQIWIGDREVSGLEPRDRHIGMMFQGYALYPHLSVRDNLAYPLRVRGVPREEVARRVADVARMLGIEDLLGRRIHQISGGQQQRVAIGRAIVQKPNVYLLDEPISNLDASLRESVRAEIRRLQRVLGATMIVVTHDQLDALAIADRIALLHGGVLQQHGTPQEIYTDPANAFVAAFIGRARMNLLSCRVADGQLAGRGYSIPLPPSAGAALRGRATPRVTVGIRPQDIGVRTSPEPGALPAVVETVLFQGDEALCEARAGEERLRVAVPGGQHVGPGQAVWLTPRPDRLYLFDPESGARLDAAGGRGGGPLSPAPPDGLRRGGR